jgi:small subunit ribosomal protein S21
MIIVPIKEGENIERALKKFKRKFEKTGAVREMRARKTFVKKSVKLRDQRQKAIYRQQMQRMEESL